MSDKLKKFINDHRDEFDSSKPSDYLWENIDSRMENKTSHWIKSKWLKYFAFGASMVILTVFLIAEFSVGTKERAISKMEGTSKTTGNLPEMNISDDKSNKEANNGTERTVSKIASLASSGVKETSSVDSVSVNADTTHASVRSELSVKETEKTGTGPSFEESERKTIKSKKEKVYIPEDLAKINTYSGTLYNSSDLCEIVRVYKFPGKVNAYPGSYNDDKDDKVSMQTMSCSRLEAMKNIKAVWVKGRTDKKTTIPVKKGFKNILLLKGDGRVLSPEAISHYYPGLGVISKTGHFNMVFKDKVELILFFKDAEEGDKIVIDGIIEAIIKNKP
jgi:hypothetical protein